MRTRVKIIDNSNSLGLGLTGLTHEAVGLTITAICDNQDESVVYHADDDEIEGITTVGTFEEPAAGKCRFGEVDPDNPRGLYEVQLSDTIFPDGAEEVIVTVYGAPDAADADVREVIEGSAADSTPDSSVTSFVLNEVKNRLKARMGFSARVLEFSAHASSGEVDHLEEAIQQALDLFNKYLYRTVWAQIPETTETQMVVRFGEDAESPDETDPDLQAVVAVSFTRPAEISASQEDPFTLAARMQGGGYFGGYGGRMGHMAPSGRYGFGDILFYKMQREAVGRVTSNDPDWLWDAHQRLLTLYMPQGPYVITYQKAYPHTLSTLPVNYAADFLKAAEGYARCILADIRGKFGQQIPGPTGGTETDAATQLQRGEKLIDDVEQRLGQMPLVAGVEFG